MFFVNRKSNFAPFEKNPIIFENTIFPNVHLQLGRFDYQKFVFVFATCVSSYLVYLCFQKTVHKLSHSVLSKLQARKKFITVGILKFWYNAAIAYILISE